MNRYRYGGLDQKGLYIDETVMRMCYTHRRLFAQLALALISEQKNDKALKVLQKADKVMPDYTVPYNYMSGGLDFAKAYAILGKKAEASNILDKVWLNAVQYAQYYLQLEGSRFSQSQRDCMIQLSIMNQACEVYAMLDKTKAAKAGQTLDALYRMYVGKGGHTGAQE